MDFILFCRFPIVFILGTKGHFDDDDEEEDNDDDDNDGDDSFFHSGVLRLQNRGYYCFIRLFKSGSTHTL